MHAVVETLVGRASSTRGGAWRLVGPASHVDRGGVASPDVGGGWSVRHRVGVVVRVEGAGVHVVQTRDHGRGDLAWDISGSLVVEGGGFREVPEHLGQFLLKYSNGGLVRMLESVLHE